LDNIFVERLWRNVKHEDVYLKGYANMAELMVGLAQYFAFYNGERPHQSLGYRTPASVYRSGDGGGALIVDRYGSAAPEMPALDECACPGALPQTPPGQGRPLNDKAVQQQGKRSTGQRRPAAVLETDTA
jgi:putative transposase